MEPLPQAPRAIDEADAARYATAARLTPGGATLK